MNRPTATFNGTDLASAVPGLMIVANVPNRFPNRDLSVGQLALADKSITTMAFYKDKKINIQVEIFQNTRELLDDSIDMLYGILQAQEAALVCSVGSTTRQWTATLNNVSISNQQGGHAELDIEFQCSDPFGKDVNSTTLFSTNLTGATGGPSFIVYGTAPYQQPVITITYSALTGGTSKTVVVGNTTTGQQISITRNWTAGDVLVIDSVNKTVKVNGTAVAFTGSIPEWSGSRTGTAGSLDYSDTLTTRTRSMVAVYNKRYV